MYNDSLKVSENSDGSFQIEWDQSDPVWSFLNDMTENEINEWFSKAIDSALEKYKDFPLLGHSLVEEDPITGEFYITIPPDLVKLFNLSEGDKLSWTDNCDGTFSIKKSKEETNGTI